MKLDAVSLAPLLAVAAATAVLVRVVAALRVPHGQVVVRHDGGGILGVQEGRLGVGVASLALLGVGSVHGLLTGNIGGALHGAAVDDKADGEANEAADAHAGPVDDLVAGAHLVAAFKEDSETAADKDVYEELEAVIAR